VAMYDFDWRTGAWTHREDTGSRSSLFDPLEPRAQTTVAFEPPPYRAYLEVAHELAARLGSSLERDIPRGVPQELVFFKH
jgi:hypothetical protein